MGPVAQPQICLINRIGVCICLYVWAVPASSSCAGGVDSAVALIPCGPQHTKARAYLSRMPRPAGPPRCWGRCCMPEVQDLPPSLGRLPGRCLLLQPLDAGAHGLLWSSFLVLMLCVYNTSKQWVVRDRPTRGGLIAQAMSTAGNSDPTWTATISEGGPFLTLLL